MNVADFFLCKNHVFVQNQKKIKFQMFVIYLNRQTLKILLSPNSRSQNDFFHEIGLYTFILIYLWAKYEPIWTDFTAQRMILGANLLVIFWLN